MKTIFLLYLSLPQTRGSSYLYIHYLQPFLHEHEHEIDATIVRVKNKIYGYVQDKLRMLWDYLMASVGRPPSQPGASAVADTAQPPTMGDPVSGPAQLLGGFWRSYGPTLLASGASLFTAANAAAAAQQNPFAAQGANRPRDSFRSDFDRRTHSSSDEDTGPAPVYDMPTQRGSSSYLPSSKRSSDVDVRARGGQFEEIEVPSDVEGYDVGASAAPSGVRPTAGGRRTSWFGWGGPADKGDKDD